MKKYLLFLLSIGALPASEGFAAVAEISFAAPTRPVETGGALSSVSGDLDGDGTDEFVTAASNGSSNPHFRVYRRNDSGFVIYDLLPSWLVAHRQDRFGGDLVIADMNGDGRNDIVVPESNNSGGTGQVSWFRNPGSLGGTWNEIVISTWSGSGTGNVAEHMSELAVGDINGDGLKDIVTRDVSHGFWVLLRDINGEDWEPRKFVPALPREGLALWNPDNDSDLDILLNGVWFETPSDPVNGEYQQRPIRGAEAWYPTEMTGATISDYASQVETGDFNQDGRIDFVITNSEELGHSPASASKPTGIRIYLAPADVINASWTEVILHFDHFSWHSCEVGDLNGDGHLDLLSGVSQVGMDNAAGRVTAFLNEGSGLSFTEQDIAFGNDSAGAPTFIYNASIGDADGDGDLDIFAPYDWSSGPVYFFENSSTAPGLQIVQQPDQVTVSWPRTLAGFQLEIARPSTPWTLYSGPYFTNRHSIFVNETSVADEVRLYRLKRSP